MNRSSAERVIGTTLAIASAVLALVVDNDAEMALFMAAAVIGSLACFDAAMNRGNRALWPWLLITASVLAKATPRVFYSLAEEGSASLDRYDDIGSVMAGGCVVLAMTLLALPARSSSASAASPWPIWTVPVIVASGLVTATLGATIGFVFDTGFGSVAEARLVETLEWGFAGSILAAAALALATASQVTRALATVVLSATATAVLLMLTAAGRDLDIGWWALVWAAFAVSALAMGRALLGPRHGRHRSSTSPMLVALVAMALAAGGVIWAVAGTTTWAPGRLVLVGLAFGLGALALLAGLRVGQRGVASGPDDDRGFDWSGSASTPAAATSAGARLSDFASEVPGASRDGVATPVAASSIDNLANDVEPVPVPSVATVAPSPPTGQLDNRAASVAEVAGTSGEPPPVAANGSPRPAGVDDPPDIFASDVPPVLVPMAESTTPAPVGAGQVAAEQPPTAATPAGEAQSIDPTQAPGVEPSSALSAHHDAADTGERRDLDQRPGVSVASALPSAPLFLTSGLDHRHIDPPTGLLSAAGLQVAMGRAFETTMRRPGEIAFMLVAVRNADLIERTHGRIVTDTMYRELARRLRSALPEALCARYARTGFAALLVGVEPPTEIAVERFTAALRVMLLDLPIGSLSLQLDLAAGVSQCYANEDAAGVADRANEGLVRAMSTVDPTLVAMP